MGFRGISIVLTALTLLLAGCTGERQVARATRDGILLLGNGPEPQSLDPHVTTGTAELNIQMALFEGLVTPHPESLDPIPGVATSWEVGEDAKRFTFKLRKDAAWTDGTPVTAKDFVAAWERALNPLQATPYASMLHVLAGAEAYNKGETSDFSTVGVNALADDLLEVRLARPVPFFLSLILHPVWSPVPSHLLEQQDRSDRSGAWTLPGTFIGNGPFVLKEWLPSQYVEVARNELYWEADSVFLEGVRFVAIDEPAAEERAFLSGQLHLTDALPPARVAAYKEQNSPELRIDSYLGTYYILANLREGVLADAKVRRALAMAIDRKAITEKLLGAGQRAAGGFVPDNMPGYAAHIPVEYDPIVARNLLSDAGFDGGKGFPKLEYLFNSSESHRKIAEALQAMWKENLGIEITLTNQEMRTYLQRRASGDFQLARAVWIGDYIEPSTFLDLWTSDNSNNWAGWASPSYDALMESARETMNPGQRMRRYTLAERYLIAEQVVIPLYHYVTVYLKDPVVQGWYPNLLDWHPLKSVYFE
ncbi:MAG: peptide ABC transporter substrate-binding protein [Puniceicoccaceae bacterium]